MGKTGVEGGNRDRGMNMIVVFGVELVEGKEGVTGIT
jgi:hypothetical protein